MSHLFVSSLLRTDFQLENLIYALTEKITLSTLGLCLSVLLSALWSASNILNSRCFHLIYLARKSISTVSC